MSNPQNYSTLRLVQVEVFRSAHLIERIAVNQEIADMIKKTVASMCNLYYLIGEKRGGGNTEYSDPLMLASASQSFNAMMDKVVQHYANAGTSTNNKENG